MRRLSSQRFFKFWSAPDRSFWIVLSLPAWLGMFEAMWQKGLETAPYAIVLAMFPLIYYPTHTGSTYRHPVEPVILVLAAHASVTAVALLAKRWPGTQ